MTTRPGRLIVSPNESAAMNMAVDQAILQAAENAPQQWLADWAGCLRLYQWAEPTLSLGYFQSAAQRNAHLPSRDAVLVRRASGGGAIMHHHELTYSLLVPKQHRLATGADAPLYERVHLAIAEAIGQFGPRPMLHCRSGTGCANKQSGEKHSDAFLCFQRRTANDLILGGYKVVGSAQRQGRQFVLQHGSILVAASSLAPELPGLNQLGAKISQPDALLGPISDQLSETLGICWQNTAVSDTEAEMAAQFTLSRFSDDRWTQKR